MTFVHSYLPFVGKFKKSEPVILISRLKNLCTITIAITIATTSQIHPPPSKLPLSPSPQTIFLSITTIIITITICNSHHKDPHPHPTSSRSPSPSPPPSPSPLPSPSPSPSLISQALATQIELAKQRLSFAKRQVLIYVLVMFGAMLVLGWLWTFSVWHSAIGLLVIMTSSAFSWQMSARHALHIAAYTFTILVPLLAIIFLTDSTALTARLQTPRTAVST